MATTNLETPAQQEQDRFLTELLNTTASTVASVVKRMDQSTRNDQETLDKILTELQNIQDGRASRLAAQSNSNPSPAKPDPNNPSPIKTTNPGNSPLATSIQFHESPAVPHVAGNTLRFTGALSPSNSVLASDRIVTVTSSDPAVKPTADTTGLLISVPLPSNYVANPTNPLKVMYTAVSKSTGQSISGLVLGG